MVAVTPQCSAQVVLELQVDCHRFSVGHSHITRRVSSVLPKMQWECHAMWKCHSRAVGLIVEAAWSPWPMGMNPDGAPGLSLGDMASPLPCQNRADLDGPESNRANHFCSSADMQARGKMLALVLEAVATLPAFQSLSVEERDPNREAGG